MKLKTYINKTTFDATKDMVASIDYSDFSIEHIVIVPDRFSLQMEKLLLSTLKNKALFNVRVMGFTSLATWVFNKLNMKVDVLTSAESLLLTQQAIENVNTNFLTFKKNNINFCYEINKTLAQIKSCKIKPSELNISASTLAGEKYHDLMLIYDEYQKLLNGRLDANERLLFLNQAIKESGVLKNCKFYFAQFDSFTAVGYELIKTLIQSSKEVNISLTSPLSIGNSYIYEDDIQKKISRISQECGIEVEVIDKNTVFSTQKRAILEGVYSYQIKSVANNDFYSAYQTISLRDEVLSCAKLIYYLTSKGYNYKDIIIATSDIKKYQPYIEEFLDKFDIPYFIDSSITSDKSLLADLIFKFFEVILFGYSKEKLIGLCQHILLEKQDELISVIEKYNVNSRWKYKKYIAPIFSYDNILQMIEQCQNGDDYKVVVDKIYQTVREKYNLVENFLEEKGYIKERDINRQIPEILTENTSLISKYCKNISLSQYIKTLHLLLSFKEVSTVPTFVDGVMIGDASASYFGDCKILIILGCQELPIVSSDNGLLSDNDLSFTFLDKKIEPTIRMINRRNRFRLFNLLSLPSDKLVVFNQLNGSDGRKGEPPAFVDCLNKIFSTTLLRSQDVFYINNFEKDLDSTLVKLGNRKLFAEEYLKELTNQDKEHLGFNNFLPFDNFIIDKTKIECGKEMFLDQRKISVTQLENYFSCPFKHYLSYGLCLQEKEETTFDGRDIGNICHKASELFVKEIIDGKSFQKEDVNLFINNHFDEIIEEACLKDKLEIASERESLIRYFKHQLEVVLCDILSELSKSNFKPLYVEYKLSNITLGIDNKVDISGKIDRIDVCNNYFRIIDYKTGSTGIILKELYHGLKLQLFLYQKIAKKMLNMESAGVFYFNAKYDYSKADEDKTMLKGIAKNTPDVLENMDKDLSVKGQSSILSLYIDKYGNYKGSVVAKEDLDVYENYALKVSNEAVEEIAGGYIQPKPIEEACRYCKYRSICLYENIEGQRKTIKVENFKDLLKDE